MPADKQQLEAAVQQRVLAIVRQHLLVRPLGDFDRDAMLADLEKELGSMVELTSPEGKPFTVRLETTEGWMEMYF